MVARGDLGAELPIEEVPLLQVISLFLIEEMIEIIGSSRSAFHVFNKHLLEYLPTFQTSGRDNQDMS